MSASKGVPGDAVPDDYVVRVDSPNLKFTAAHFVAFRGFRERLHGHNYTVALALGGARQPHPGDGYVVDFGLLKDAAKKECKELNEHVLIPVKSDVLGIDASGNTVRIVCEGGHPEFAFPLEDCALLPIVHSTAEEIAGYLWGRVVGRLGGAGLLWARGVRWLEISVGETPYQSGSLRRSLRDTAPLPTPVPRPCCGLSSHAVAGTETLPNALATAEPAVEHEALVPATQDRRDVLAALQGAIDMLLKCIGEDPTRQGLLDTPLRAAKAWLEITEGHREALEDMVTGVSAGIFEEGAEDLAERPVIVRNIPFFSLCEHHLLPFFGVAHVAYTPSNGRVLGLSKVARIVRWAARRLQLQERLTKDIARGIEQLVQPRGIAVALSGVTHLCMSMRGVECHTSETDTSTFTGCLDTPAERAEFLAGNRLYVSRGARL